MGRKAASLAAQRVKNLPAMQETGFDPWVGKIPWRRKWQPTPVLWPGEFHGQRPLMGYSPKGRKESDMTKWLTVFSVYVCVCVCRGGEKKKEREWWSPLQWHEVGESRLWQDPITATSLSIPCLACVTTDFLNSITTTPICLLNTYFAQNITWDVFHVSMSKHD